MTEQGSKISEKGEMIESQKVEGQKMEDQKMEDQKIEEQKIEELEEQKIEELKDQKIEELEDQKIEDKKIEDHKIENQKNKELIDQEDKLSLSLSLSNEILYKDGGPEMNLMRGENEANNKISKSNMFENINRDHKRSITKGSFSDFLSSNSSFCKYLLNESKNMAFRSNSMIKINPSYPENIIPKGKYIILYKIIYFIIRNKNGIYKNSKAKK